MKNISRGVRLCALCLALMLLPLALHARAEKTAGIVRVLLTRLNLTNQAEISLDGSYTLNDLSFQRGSHLTVTCSGDSLYVYYEGMALNAGKTLTLKRHATEEGKENGVRFSGRYELHPGDLVLSAQNGQLRAVLHAPVEEYLLGVVPYEMSDSFPVEALKSQAIAARTYALRKVGAQNDYDVVDNTNDQAYYGVRASHTNAAEAVRATEGMCGYYKDSLAECYYSASNGGQTELVSHVWGNADCDYLVMVDDPYDLENPESTVKRYSFAKSMENGEGLGKLKDQVMSALSEIMESRGYDGDQEHIRVTGIQNAEVALPLYPDSPSKVMTMLRLSLQVQGRRLMDDDGEEDVSMFDTSPTSPPRPRGEQWSAMTALPQPVVVTLDLFPQVEKLLDLSINAGRNEIMSIRETDDAFILESRRFGHGVGMSQRGAQQMAKKYDWTCEQILRFYYPGMTVKKVEYTYVLPTPLSQQFLTTPGPAATPTPRPTPMPISATPGPNEYKVRVTNIGVNSYLNLREAPNTQAGVLRQLFFGQELIVTQELEDWLHVKTDDIQGYVMTEFVTKIE